MRTALAPKSREDCAIDPPGIVYQESFSRSGYHWHSATVRDFVSDPHAAIVCKPQGEILNLVDARAVKAQSALLAFAQRPVGSGLNEARKLTMPSHHDVRAKDVDLKRLGAVLAVAHEQDLRDFASLLLVEGLGPGALQSLPLIARGVQG